MEDLNGTQHESYRTMGLAPVGARYVDNYGNIYYGGSTSVGNVFDEQRAAFWAGFNTAPIWPEYTPPPASSTAAVDYGSVGSYWTSYPAYKSCAVTSSPTVGQSAPQAPKLRRVPQRLTLMKKAILAGLAALGIGLWSRIGPQLSDGGCVIALCEVAAFLMLSFIVRATPNALPVKGRWCWRAGVCVQWLVPLAIGFWIAARLAESAQLAAIPFADFILVALLCAMPGFLLVSVPVAVVMYYRDPLRKPKL